MDDKQTANKQTDKVLSNGKCEHLGSHNPVSQSIFLAGVQLWIINSHNCNRCGHVFTNINPVDVPPGAGQNIVAMPNFDISKLKNH